MGDEEISQAQNNNVVAPVLEQKSNKKWLYITVPIIIVLLLIIGFLVFNIGDKNSDAPDIILDLNVKSFYIAPDNMTAYVSVHRGEGEGDISSLIFTFQDSGSYVYKYDNLAGLPTEESTKIYEINVEEIRNQSSSFNDFSGIESVSISFEYETSSGEIITSPVADTFSDSFDTDTTLPNQVNTPSESSSSGGSSGGGSNDDGDIGNETIIGNETENETVVGNETEPVSEMNCLEEEIFKRINETTVFACSCNQSDVQAAINNVSDGETVIVSEGECTWTNEVSFNKAITLQGAGKDATFIKATGVERALYITANHGLGVRITGFTFDGNFESFNMYIEGSMAGTTLLRIYNNTIKNGAPRGMRLAGNLYGVIDNNEFIDNVQADISVRGGNDWTTPVSLGTANAIYVEDNTFTHTSARDDAEHVIAGNQGARYVFRYNTINSLNNDGLEAPIDAHGLCTDGNPSGTFSYEIYGNTVIAPTSGNLYRGMFIRGGTGVIYNNTLENNIQKAIHLTNYRSWSDICTSTCPAEGDDNAFSYLCDNQIHDLFVWGNKLNGGNVLAEVDDRGLNTIHLQENRDFFNREPEMSLDGFDYASYTYPHPLRSS